MSLAQICVYTIIHPARLEEHARNGRGVPLSEKTRWTRIELALKEAERQGDEIAVLFSDARRCDVLFAWAPLADVRVGKTTDFWLKGVYALPGNHRKTALTSFVGKKRISSKHIRPYLPCETPAFAIEAAAKPNPWTYALEDFAEGRRVLRLHQTRERSRKLRADKLREVGDLVRCEVCEFDFAVRYPGVGEGFIEVHHREPLADRATEGGPTKLEDLALVCANCHRMLHRSERISIHELRDMVRTTITTTAR